MWEFIQGLFLAKLLLLAGPGDFVPGTHQIEIREPVSAISGGASLRLDITSMVPQEARSLAASREWIEKTFPDNSIRATLKSKDGLSVNLSFDGASSWEPESIQLIIAASEGVPKGVEFSSLALSTDLHLQQVTLTWANYKL